LIRNGNIALPQEAGPVLHAYNQYVIRAERRDDLKAYLLEQGIGTEIYYPVPLHLQVCFRDLMYERGDLPESEKAANEALAIPIYPELGLQSQERIVETISSFYN
jgi:dTDP-4-amino-4,6-dideoxygalactose transaminase